MKRTHSSHVIAAVLFATISSVYVETKFCEVACTRVSELKDVGFDNSKVLIFIDKGKCQSNYTVEEGCEIPPAQDCDRVCQPRALEIQRYHNRDGPQIEIAIKSCYRPNHSCLNKCELKRSFVHLFSGSKYHQRVDVGRCVGPCQETDPRIQCVSTRNVTEAFEGPNGFVTLDIVKECSCGNTNCYRSDYFESYTTNNASNPEKVLNVGRCVGSCPGITLPAQCFPDPDNCVWELQPRPSHCVSTSSTKEVFTDAKGIQIKVPLIKTCGCGSG